MRIVGVRVRRKAAGRAMLKALIDRQDDQLAGAAQLTLHQDARQVGFGAGRIAFVIIEDALDALGDLHGIASCRF